MQNAAQIQDKIRLKVRVREPFGVIDFRLPLLEQITCARFTHLAHIEGWNKRSEVRAIKRNTVLREEVMINNPFVACVCFSIKFTEPPPWPRSFWRQNLLHEFKRNIRAFKASFPGWISIIQTPVHPLNRLELRFIQGATYYRLQIYITSFWRKVAIRERPGQIQADYVFTKNIFCFLCPIGEKNVDILVWRQFSNFFSIHQVNLQH